MSDPPPVPPIEEDSSRVALDLNPIIEDGGMDDSDDDDEFDKMIHRIGWRWNDRAEYQKAYKAYEEFCWYFDDVDADGSERISEVELQSSLDILLRFEEEDMDETKALEDTQRTLVENWVTGTGQQGVYLNDDDKTTWKDELRRDQLIEMLLYNFVNHPDDLGRYTPGGYAKRVKQAREVQKSYLRLGVLFLQEQVKIMFYPFCVYGFRIKKKFLCCCAPKGKADDEDSEYFSAFRLDDVDADFRFYSFWPSVVVVALLAVNMALWVLNVQDIRRKGKSTSGGGLTHSEFGFPFFWFTMLTLCWNFARYCRGDEPYAGYRLRKKNARSRMRSLLSAPLSNPFVYDPKIHKWRASSHAKSSFSNAFQVYTNIFNIVGSGSGYGQWLLPEIIKHPQRKDDALKEFSYLRMVKGWDVSLAFCVAFTHVFIRIVEGDKLFGNERFAESFVVCTSFLLSLFLVTIILVMIRHITTLLKAYNACLEVLGMFVNRKQARRLMYIMQQKRSDEERSTRMRKPSRQVTIKARMAPEGMECPWVYLQSMLNLNAWNHIREALVEEWHELMGGLPYAVTFVSFSAVVILAAGIMISVFFFSARSGNGFRYSCMLGAIVLSLHLHNYLYWGIKVNNNSQKHIETLAEAQLKLFLHVEQEERGPEPAADDAKHADEKDAELRHRPGTGLDDKPGIDRVTSTGSTGSAHSRDESEHMFRRMNTSNGADLELRRSSALVIPPRPTHLNEWGKRYMEHGALLGTYITVVSTSTRAYAELFGWKMDSSLKSQFVSIISLWFFLVVANSILRDFNF